MIAGRLIDDIRIRIALFGVAYFIVTSITVGVTRFQGGLALMWFGTSVGVGCLTTIDRKHWPLALTALTCISAFVTAVFGFGPKLALPLALVNAFEVWLSARLLLAARPQRDWLDSMVGLVTFVAVCGITAPVSAGFFGALAANTTAPGGVLYHFISWVVAHTLGMLIGFPVVQFAMTALLRDGERDTHPASALEFALHLFSIAAVSALALGAHRLPLLFLPIVPLMFAAIRCGRAGSALGIVIVGTVAVLSLHEGLSALAALPYDMRGKVFFLQFYLATLSLLAIPCSVALRQHRLVLLELAYRKAVNRLIVENSDDALVNLDERGNIRFASPAAERFTGIADLEGRHFDTFFDPLDAGIVREALNLAQVSPMDTVVIERPVANGNAEVWLEAKLRTAAKTAGSLTLRGFAVTIRDITERKQGEINAINAADTDTLTQLPNRRVVLRQLERALADAKNHPIAFAIVDLDHFKAINDTHGHVFGDEVLRAVAKVMHRYSTPTRTLARLGGEEFAVIDIQPDFAESAAMCDDLRGAIAAIMPQVPGGERMPITASIGLTGFVRPIDLTQAMQAADALLYRAKHQGRNRVEAAAPGAVGKAERRAA